MKESKFYVMTFFLLVLLLGCAAKEKMYEGKAQAEESVGRVSTTGMKISLDRVYFKKVDDKSLGSFVNEVELLPGKHSFQLKYSITSYYTEIWIWGFIDLNVEAGHSYLIDMDYYFIWAVDKESGKVVAGVMPP